MLPRRWVVERTIIHIGHFRRLSTDDDYYPERSETISYRAMHQLVRRRLAIGRRLAGLTRNVRASAGRPEGSYLVPVAAGPTQRERSDGHNSLRRLRAPAGGLGYPANGPAHPGLVLLAARASSALPALP